MRTTGEIIREYRKKNNLTTNDFAKTLGVSGVFIFWQKKDSRSQTGYFTKSTRQRWFYWFIEMGKKNGNSWISSKKIVRV